jgi:hypothetical protein
VGYCRLLTISTDNITETNEFRTAVGAHWPFQSSNAHGHPLHDTAASARRASP